MTTNDNKTYIKITDEDDEPSVQDLMALDKFDEMEYTSPYNHTDEDLFNVGGIIETGSIFDDR